MQKLLDIQKELGVAVSVITFPELVPVVGFAEATAYMQRSWECGGFQTTYFTEKARQAAAAAMTTDEFRQQVLAEPLGPRIVGLGPLVERLTEPTVEAIMAHEYGHVYHKHITPEIIDANLGRILDLEMEAEADAYAAELIGKETMKNALTEIKEVMMQMIREAPGLTEEQRELALADQLRLSNHPIILERIARLTA